MSTINDRLREILKACKLKQHDFAVALGITDSSVSTMCSGKSNPSGQTINDICRVYNVNRAWLETGEGEMFKPLKQQAEIEKLFKEVLSEPKDNGEQFRKALINAIARIPSDRWGDIADTFEILAMLYNDEKNGK